MTAFLRVGDPTLAEAAVQPWTSVVLGLAFVSSAAASAQLLSPLPNAVTTSHPTFSWTVGSEVADVIAIAYSPEVTAEGQFFAENIEDSDKDREGHVLVYAVVGKEPREPIRIMGCPSRIADVRA